MRAAIAAARGLVGGVGTDDGTDPAASHRECSELLAASIEQAHRRLADDEVLALQATNVGASLDDARARLDELEGESAELTRDWDGLIEALAGLIPHLDADDCPVCGRDFQELQRGSLAHHVEAIVENYSEESARVRAIGAERSELQSQIADSTRELSSIEQRRVTDEELARTRTRLGALREALATLEEVGEAALEGTALHAEAAALAQQARAAGSAAAAAADLRSRLASELAGLGEEPVGTDVRSSALAAAQRLAIQRDALATRLAASQAIADEFHKLELLIDRISTAERELADVDSRRRRVDESTARVMRLKTSVTALANAASAARTEVVAQVFQGSLNKTWRDLFLRLAVDEPFVPEFGVPVADRRLTSVEVRTAHRDGTGGGAPATMLSAGNLNTAALTLFLALHLTVESRVRCLILDDPVQSMDEVHVSQFAALLRTLSRQLDRQVVIAVHERALFEYLRLELSPAEEGSQLITVELQRGDGSDTECISTVIPWVEDRAVQVDHAAGL